MSRSFHSRGNMRQGQFLSQEENNSNCNQGCCRKTQRRIHRANGNMCATHGRAWTKWEPRAGEAHWDLATNNHHTSLAYKHTRFLVFSPQPFEDSHYNFLQVLLGARPWLSACAWCGDKVYPAPACESACRTPRELRGPITANCLSRVQTTGTA